MKDEVFIYDRPALERLTGAALDRAKTLGSSDATAHIADGDTLSLTVRHGAVDVMARRRSKQLSVTVYHDGRRGSAHSTDLSDEAIAATVEAAWNIASFTDRDEFAAPLAARYLARGTIDLDLFHRWALAPDAAIDIAREMEAAALASSPLIVNDADPDADDPRPRFRAGGASVFVQHHQSLLATSQGFCNGYAQSLHGLSCMVIAEGASGMQTGAWQSAKRAWTDLDDAASVGRTAACRALAKLGARRLTTRTCPVLFEAPVAATILYALVGAISGDAQYREQSFLTGALDQRVMSAHLDVEERPHELRGLASAPFDAEGAPTSDRSIVLNGVLKSYLLSGYSARKLNMAPTGHGSGVHNLALVSRQTAATDSLPKMVNRLGTGLLVTDMMGGGANPVTGDYSQGVAGFWVEGGEVQFPVEQITISGNLRAMLSDIVAVGNDVHIGGPVRTGSILFERLQVAGL